MMTKTLSRRTALVSLVSATSMVVCATPALALTAPASSRTRLVATASYTSLAEWGRIRQALARTTGIQDVRIDAISIDGALLALSYVGTLETLRTELRRGGLSLATEAIGPVIRLAE